MAIKSIEASDANANVELTAAETRLKNLLAAPRVDFDRAARRYDELKSMRDAAAGDARAALNRHIALFGKNDRAGLEGLLRGAATHEDRERVRASLDALDPAGAVLVRP